MSLDDQDYAEKRDFIRMFINAPVDYKISGEADWVTGTGINLSGGGLSFKTDQQLSKNDKVEIKLHPVTEVTPPLEAKVTVIRIDEEDGDYLISAKIDRITG